MQGAGRLCQKLTIDPVGQYKTGQSVMVEQESIELFPVPKKYSNCVQFLQ